VLSNMFKPVAGLFLRAGYGVQCLAIRNKSRIGVVGACFDQGQPHEGVGDAPAHLRQAGLLQKLEARGFQVLDYGNLQDPRVDGKQDKKAVIRFNEKISECVGQALRENDFCLTLGGDHSVGLGTVAGHLAQDAEAVVIWVDAHADINTLASSDTGNMHGMPVSFNIQQLQEGNSELKQEMDWIKPRLHPSRLAYIGLRDVDSGEWSYIQRLSIPTFPMDTINRIGVASAITSALNVVDPKKERKIHLSFDIDVLDPVEAPATGTRVRGGLTLREATTLCQILQETGRLTAMDLVEVNPSLARSQAELDTTVEAAVEVVLAALGNP